MWKKEREAEKELYTTQKMQNLRGLYIKKEKVVEAIWDSMMKYHDKCLVFYTDENTPDEAKADWPLD